MCFHFLNLLIVVLSFNVPGESQTRATTETSAAAKPIEVKFPSGILTLHGFIYRPEGKGPFPAVLWNHGSEKRPGWLPQLGELFARRGYVFFIPHRRGQGRSPGEYVMDQLEKEGREGGAAARSKKLLELMEVHLQDQIAALSYLKGLEYVDKNKIAVAGCSFGGIQTLLAAGSNLDIKAAIDFAGAAQTWQESPDLRERMLSAAGQASAPILLIQAENDYDLAPSRAINQELERLGKPHQLVIFPSYGKTAQDGHSFCVHAPEVWDSEVFNFLRTAMPQ